MGRKSELPTDWKDQIAEESAVDSVRELGAGTEEFSAIPLKTRATVTMYMEARQLATLKRLSQRTGLSLQELMRQGIKLILDKHGGGRKKRSPRSKKK